jgi:hypothetical protein
VKVFKSSLEAQSMVNQLQVITPRVVKLQAPRPGDQRVTAKAGLALIQALARRTRLPRDIDRLLPARRDPSQGFTVSATLLALIHGLLSGGRGLSATEPLREDAPLLALLGLSRAPSAETVEEVIKYLAGGPAAKAGAAPLPGHHDAMQRLVAKQARRLILRSPRAELTLPGTDFVPVWADGSLLEVDGKNFDAIKTIGGARGQMAVGCFAGPVAAGLTVAGEGQGQGEESVARGLLDRAVAEVLRPCGLLGRTLFLLDGLYGDGPALTQLERYAGARYIVGARKLAAAEKVMTNLPDNYWRATGPDARRGWAASGVATAWLQCEDWPVKRQIVCRRWKEDGEFIWHCVAVVTNLTQNDSQIENLMRQNGIGFEETVWQLYGRKQAMENQWKELLTDLGLHHPPSARAAVNAIFYGAAALAYNLAVGARLIGLAGPDRRMRLWRLRREVLDVAGRAMRHGRSVVVRLLDACGQRIDRLLAAMARLARC